MSAYAEARRVVLKHHSMFGKPAEGLAMSKSTASDLMVDCVGKTHRQPIKTTNEENIVIFGYPVLLDNRIPEGVIRVVYTP